MTIATASERARAFVPVPLPPEPPIQWSQELRVKFDRALLALGRLDAIPTFLPEFASFIPLIAKKEAILSSMSEEKRCSLETLLFFEVEAGNPVENTDLSEISKLSSLIPWIWEQFNGKQTDFVGLIREAHRRLFGESSLGTPPGEFRGNQKRLSVTQPGNASFIPPPAENIAACMSDLERFLDDRPAPTPFLIKAALAQAQFELIQPFQVGNSRLARMIPLMLMRAHQVLGSPIIVTSSYFARHRKEYYDSLNAVRASGDWEAWLGYFATAVASSAEKSFEDMRSLAERSRRDVASVLDLGRPADSALQVLHAMIEQPMATSNWLVSKTGITPATVNKSLAHLAELGIVAETTFKKRNRIFAYTEYIEILKNDIRDFSTC